MTKTEKRLNTIALSEEFQSIMIELADIHLKNKGKSLIRIKLEGIGEDKDILEITFLKYKKQ